MGKWAGGVMLGIFAAGVWISASKAANSSVQLAWDPSPDTNVTGYFLYFGLAPASYTDRFDVGALTAATFVGLTPGTTNYFAVTAYDAHGLQSIFSNELSFIAPGALQASLQSSNCFHLLFAVAAKHSYDIQCSDAFTNWTTLATISSQTNNIYDFVDTNFTSVSRRFYRLILR